MIFALQTLKSCINSSDILLFGELNVYANLDFKQGNPHLKGLWAHA